MSTRIYIAHHHELVAECAHELGWTVTDDETKCNIHWKIERLRDATTSKDIPNIPARPTTPASSSRTRRRVRSSVITGLGQAVTKDALTSSMEAFGLLLGNTNMKRCTPKTFCLPSQLNMFKEHLNKASSSAHYIYKPSCGSQGKGIHLFNGASGWRELAPKIEITTVPESGRHDYIEKNIPRSVVQKYIANPYLKLGGLKFDFRLYVLVESLDPLQIWLCDEGLVRFCTVPYKKPTKANMKESKNLMCQHLSNYSINKKNHVGYIHSAILNPDPLAKSDGTKRTLTSVLAEMKDLDEDVDQMMNDIQHLIIQASAALQSEIILRNGKRNISGRSDGSSGGNGGGNSFQLLGFDIMIDKSLKPYLLEVNANPSLRTDFTSKGLKGGDKDLGPSEFVTMESPVDKYIKSIVVKGALLIVTNNNREQLENNEHVKYTNLKANEANFVRRATWITSRVRRFYERLCRGRDGLPCNIFCRSLRSILRLRGALVSPGKGRAFTSAPRNSQKLHKTDMWFPVQKRRSRKRSGSMSTRSNTNTNTSININTANTRRSINSRSPLSKIIKRRPVSAGRTRKTNKGFEAGRLFLLFAKCVGERMTKGYTSLDTTMTFCQFMPALVTLSRQQYPNCPDAVTALDTLLAEAEEAERNARQTLMTSVTTKSHSLGHLIILKDMMEDKSRRERAKLLNRELDSKLIEERREMTKKRQEKKRKELAQHLERRKKHEKQRKKLLEKEKKGREEKKRRQMEFKKWFSSGKMGKMGNTFKVGLTIG